MSRVLTKRQQHPGLAMPGARQKKKLTRRNNVSRVLTKERQQHPGLAMPGARQHNSSHVRPRKDHTDKTEQSHWKCWSTAKTAADYNQIGKFLEN